MGVVRDGSARDEQGHDGSHSRELADGVCGPTDEDRSDEGGRGREEACCVRVGAGAEGAGGVVAIATMGGGVLVVIVILILSVHGAEHIVLYIVVRESVK